MAKPEHTRSQVERWLIPLLIIAFCVAAYWLSTTFKKMPPILKRGIQPSDFPQLLLTAIVLMTLAMMWIDPVRVKERLQGTVVGTLFLFAVFAALTSIDFFLALAVFAGALAFYWGERRASILALVAIIMPVAIFSCSIRSLKSASPAGF